MLANLGLSADQVAERRKGIGSSDARVVAVGTDEERYQLWLEKTGRAEPKSIFSPWDAALRHHCEPLILDWYERETGHVLTQRGALVVSGEYEFLRANLDAVDPVDRCPVDAKMLNVWTPDPKQWVLDQYTWQIVHQIVVTAYERGRLHVSLGMKEPYQVEIAYSEFDAMSYVDRARSFWECVEWDKEPPGAPPLQTPIPIEKMRHVDMSASNEWGSFADQWLTHRDASKKFDEAAKGLKKLIEPDVGWAFGSGIEIRRQKNGLFIKEQKP